MKNGLINTVVKDAVIDFVIMPKIIALTYGVAALPVVKQFIRFIVESCLDDEVFDELQKVYNFAAIAKDEGNQGAAVNETTTELMKHEAAGVKPEDLATNEEARKAYEKWKAAVRDHIHSGRRTS